MYTSGSTGAPNGVEIPHRAIVRLVVGSEFATLGPGQVFLQLAPVQFDASTFELWGPLLTGGAWCSIPSRVPEASTLGEWIRREGVTTLWLTSTFYNALIDEAPDALRGLEQLLVGGEALSVMHVRRGLELLEGTRLINGYGPTESTVFACCWPIPRELPERLLSIPIGPPIANTRVYILDGRLRPCPIGVPGEIAIAGDGLALRYRGRAELTAARFVGSPWGERLYRTGDIGRWLDTGAVEFLGRADGQCKIRGHRIELGEIDAALAGCPGVRRAAAVVGEPSPGERELTAYVVADGVQHVTAAGLREHLSRTLPAYMLPAHILFVSEMPLNENGKLDVAKLPRPAAPPSDAMLRGSCSPAEWQLLRMCGELLPSHPPGLQDNLFEAGLHSLLATRLAARIERAFGKRISLSRIFELPTIERLAAFLEDRNVPVERVAINPLQPHGSLAPLFFLGSGPYLWPLAKRLGRPVLGLSEPHGLRDLTMEAYADRYVQTLRKVRPHGPYALAGWCVSGNEAYAVAQQLRAEGEEVALLILLDSINYAAWHAPSLPARIWRWIRRHAESLRFHCRRFSRQPAGRGPPTCASASRRSANASTGSPGAPCTPHNSAWVWTRRLPTANPRGVSLPRAAIARSPMRAGFCSVKTTQTLRLRGRERLGLEDCSIRAISRSNPSWAGTIPCSRSQVSRLSRNYCGRVWRTLSAGPVTRRGAFPNSSSRNASFSSVSDSISSSSSSNRGPLT